MSMRLLAEITIYTYLVRGTKHLVTFNPGSATSLLLLSTVLLYVVSYLSTQQAVLTIQYEHGLIEGYMYDTAVPET